MSRGVLVIGLVLAMVLGASMMTGAQDFKVSVNGGYLLAGTFTRKLPEGYVWVSGLDYYNKVTASTSGFAVNADATVSGPFGASLRYQSLDESGYTFHLEPSGTKNSEELFGAGITMDGSFTRIDLLGSYVVPFPDERFQLKALVGYAMPAYQEKITDGTTTATTTVKYPGLEVGADASIVAGSKVRVAGALLFIPAAKVEHTFEVTGSPTTTRECTSGVMEYMIKASYEISPAIRAEAGYRGMSLTIKFESDLCSTTCTNGGFFLGVAANF